MTVLSLSDYKRYLEEVKIPLRLACLTKSGWPVGLSLWFVYKDGTLYCATQEKAKVVKYLRGDSRCAFEVASDIPPYCGVRGQGKAEIITKGGLDLLKELLKKYLGSTDSPFAKKLLSRKDPEVVIKITPLKVYSWNFSDRMGSSVPDLKDHLCPSK